MSTPTLHTKKPEHLLQQASGVVPTPTKENENMTSLAQPETTTYSSDDIKHPMILDRPDAAEGFNVAPTDLPAPTWATVVEDWEKQADGSWERWVKHPITWAEGGGITIEGYQAIDTDGTVTTFGPEISIDIDDDTIRGRGGAPACVAGDARELAGFLLEAADLIQGERGFWGPAGAFQRLIAKTIRDVLKRRPIGQNQLAVAAGYGPDEFSQLMSGRRLMDIVDIERITKALEIDPLAFFLMCDEQ